MLTWLLLFVGYEEIGKLVVRGAAAVTGLPGRSASDDGVQLRAGGGVGVKRKMCGCAESLRMQLRITVSGIRRPGAREFAVVYTVRNGHRRPVSKST